MGGERRAQNVKDGDTGRARKTRQEKDEDKPCWPHVLADVTVPLLPGIPDSGRSKTRPTRCSEWLASSVADAGCDCDPTCNMYAS
jgi:hypothetical protein